MGTYYLTNNKKLRVLFSFLDAVLPQAEKSGGKEHSRGKVLLANGAHIGDVVISTAAVNLLKATCPGIKVGFVCGSWSAFLLENEPAVDYLHIVDHWFFNRDAQPPAAKLGRHLDTEAKALKEIISIGYDAAIELHSYFWDMIPLFSKARIPVRCGYASGGLGGLLTRPVQFVPRSAHESDYHVELLEEAGLVNCRNYAPIPALRGRSSVPQQLLDKLRAIPNGERGYRIVHPGTVNPSRRWPIASWRQLVSKISQMGEAVVLTGKGAVEAADNRRISDGFNNCIDASNMFSEREFIDAIHGAKLVYSVETSAGHIAAASGVPTVSIYSGVTDTERWRPRGRATALLQNKTHCSACGMKQGCVSMDCMVGIGWESVYEAGENMLMEALGK